MRENDEDAEKVLLLLHEQLMQEQTARRALEDQLQQAKEALQEAHSERLKKQQLLRDLPAVLAVSGTPATPATPAAPLEYLQLGTPPARSSSKQLHASNASNASNVCARYSVYLLY